MMRDAFILGDSMDPKTGLPGLPDKSVDHALTDPPFNEHVHGGNRRGWEIGPNGKAMPTRAMPMAFEAIDEEQITLYARQFVRVLRGWALIFCAVEQVGAWRWALDEAGAKRRNTIVTTGAEPLAPERMEAMIETLRRGGFTDAEIGAALPAAADSAMWTKSNAAPKFQGDGPAAACEAIVLAWCGTGASVWNAGGSYGHYHFPVDNGARVERRHETQKPLTVIRQLLIDFTLPGQIVIDPFAGGGSTPIGCKQLGRHFLAWERDAGPHALGMASLERAHVMTPMEQQAFHRLRRTRAYAGLAPKPTALPTQAGFDFDVVVAPALPAKATPAKRRSRGLDDV